MQNSPIILTHLFRTVIELQFTAEHPMGEISETKETYQSMKPFYLLMLLIIQILEH